MPKSLNFIKSDYASKETMILEEEIKSHNNF